MRCRTGGAPLERIKKATVPMSGGVTEAVVWAIPPVPFVKSALLLPAQSVVQVAPAESVAEVAAPELSAAVTPEPSENFHQPVMPENRAISVEVSARLYRRTSRIMPSK